MLHKPGIEYQVLVYESYVPGQNTLDPLCPGGMATKHDSIPLHFIRPFCFIDLFLESPLFGLLVKHVLAEIGKLPMFTVRCGFQRGHLLFGVPVLFVCRVQRCFQAFVFRPELIKADGLILFLLRLFSGPGFHLVMPKVKIRVEIQSFGAPPIHSEGTHQHESRGSVLSPYPILPEQLGLAVVYMKVPGQDTAGLLIDDLGQVSRKIEVILHPVVSFVWIWDRDGLGKRRRCLLPCLVVHLIVFDNPPGKRFNDFPHQAAARAVEPREIVVFFDQIQKRKAHLIGIRYG